MKTMNTTEQNRPLNANIIASAIVALIALMIVLCGLIEARARQGGYREGAINTCIENAINGCDVNDLKAKFYNEDNPQVKYDNQETRP